MKFTVRGKVEINIRIIENETNDLYLQVSVIDTGAGIPYGEQDKLFKLFGFIQDTAQMNTKGIGLGLVISEKIVNAFNG